MRIPHVFKETNVHERNTHKIENIIWVWLNISIGLLQPLVYLFFLNHNFPNSMAICQVATPNALQGSCTICINFHKCIVQQISSVSVISKERLYPERADTGGQLSFGSSQESHVLVCVSKHDVGQSSNENGLYLQSLFFSWNQSRVLDVILCSARMAGFAWIQALHLLEAV